MLAFAARLPLALRALLYAVCIGVVLWLTLSPLDELPKVTLWDKAEHAITYFILGGVGLAFFPSRPLTLTGAILAMGVVVEILQSVMGLGRQGDWHDALANTVGAVLALLAFRQARARGW